MGPRSSARRAPFPVGFNLIFGVVLTIVFSIWIGAGFLAYRVLTDPDAVAASAGRLLGVVVRSASEGASK